MELGFGHPADQIRDPRSLAAELLSVQIGAHDRKS